MRSFLIFLMVAGSTMGYCEGSPVAVVTGASRNVGLKTAELLAKRGFTVYGTTRQTAPPSSKELPNLHFLTLDLCDEEAVHAAIHEIVQKEGRIDLLINNAGFAVVGPVEALTQAEIREQMEVNFFAPIRLIQAVLPTMRAQRSGRIINISSTNAFSTPPFGSLYGASKAALETFSEALCVEVKPHDVAVSIVEPGLLSTNFSIPMGTRRVPNDPYQPLVQMLKSSLDERMAHPERLTPSQTAEEIAEFLMNVIQDPHPKLRYQTSAEAREDVAHKLRDLTGEIYLQLALPKSDSSKE